MLQWLDIIFKAIYKSMSKYLSRKFKEVVSDPDIITHVKVYHNVITGLGINYFEGYPNYLILVRGMVSFCVISENN